MAFPIPAPVSSTFKVVTSTATGCACVGGLTLLLPAAAIMLLVRIGYYAELAYRKRYPTEWDEGCNTNMYMETSRAIASMLPGISLLGVIGGFIYHGTDRYSLSATALATAGAIYERYNALSEIDAEERKYIANRAWRCIGILDTFLNTPEYKTNIEIVMQQQGVDISAYNEDSEVEINRILNSTSRTKDLDAYIFLDRISKHLQSIQKSPQIADDRTPLALYPNSQFIMERCYINKQFLIKAFGYSFAAMVLTEGVQYAAR